MADIFLSYKREDADRVRRLVAVLEDCGWTVFWDPNIVPGEVWNAVLDRELEAASCVVVLWSHLSVTSAWVLREAQRGSDREVLLPALLDRVVPPQDFWRLQATDLIGWDGDASGRQIGGLIQAITELIGRKLSPVDLNLITGDRERWIELGPTVNMGCRLEVVGRLPAALNRLELSVRRQAKPAYELAWYLFYTAADLEHVKDPYEERITIRGRSMWERGVQFRSTRADLANVWPTGSYEFDLLGWVNCLPADSGANVRTRFRAEVDQGTSLEMARWRGAGVKEWTTLGASDRALGFPLRISHLKMNLPRGS